MENPVTPFKNLNSFIFNFVNQLNYDDFSPLVKPEKLRTDFIRWLRSNQTFWIVQAKPSALKATWYFVKLNSFSSQLDDVYIGFNFMEDKIQLIVCSNINVANFIDEYAPPGECLFLNQTLKYKDVWTDHELLYKFLFEVIKRALDFANREDILEKFPNHAVNLKDDTSMTAQ